MPLKVLVTGPTGTTGRAVVQELLNRGITVTGLSRNPDRWGSHPNYTPLKGSQLGHVESLVAAVEGHDVVISAFAPSHSRDLETYAGLIEGAWRLKEAVKRSKSKPYLIYVGGAGSLLDPVTKKITLDQAQRTWTNYLFDGPIEHLNWLRGILGLAPFHIYYHLREYAHSDRLFSSVPRQFTRFFETTIVQRMSNPMAVTMPHACRAAVSFFEHDVEFRWSFLSPPWFYRNGPRTGQYGTVKDYHPVDKDGKWLGIYNGDLAVAIADETEQQGKQWTHWSCYGRQEDTAYYYDNYTDLKFNRFEQPKL